MAITANLKEQSTGTDFVREPLVTGFFEGKIVACSPTLDELNKLLGTNFENEKEYVGEDKEGNKRVTLDFYLQDVETGKILRSPLRISLVDKMYETKTGKVRFIDNKGNTSFPIDSEDNLPKFMLDNGVWQARIGEVQLYNLMRAYLNKIDFKTLEDFTFNWKKLMAGNVRELTEAIKSDLADSAIFLAQVETYEKDGETKEKQSIYPFDFIPGWHIKSLRNGNYDTTKAENISNRIKSEGYKGFKDYEKWISSLFNGNKNHFSYKELHSYDPNDNPIAQNDDAIIVSESGSDY